MRENQNTTVELVPDEDGFLFEIEDDFYALTRLVGLLVVAVGLLAILIYLDFDVMKLAHDGHRGYYLIYIGLPYIIIEFIRLSYYFYKKNYKKIKFYETYILKTNKNTKVELKDIKEGYLLKFNFSSGRMIKRSLILIVVLSTVSTMILDYRFAIVYFFMIIYLYSMVALSRYIYSFYKGNKTLFVDNIILIGNNDKDGIGIPLQIINEKEKTLIKSYVKKFLNKNIDEFEKHIFNVPLTKTENIINVETKIGDSNGR